jgi:hypothetical protein
MAFPGASNYTTAKALDKLVEIAAQIRSSAVTLNSMTAAGDTLYSAIQTRLVSWITLRSQMQALAATPGLAAYATAQYSGQGIDIVAEYTAMMTAIDAVDSWIDTNLPKDASNYELQYQRVAGVRTERTFTPAQTAGLRTQLAGLIAAIGP